MSSIFKLQTSEDGGFGFAVVRGGYCRRVVRCLGLEVGRAVVTTGGRAVVTTGGLIPPKM